MKILGISGTITGSKTLVVLNKVMEEIKAKLPFVEVEVLDLKQYNVAFCDGRPVTEYTGDTRKVINLITSADSYVIATPIFQGSFTGALKNIIDLIPPVVFKNKVMGFITIGGNVQHYLVVENQLKPIAGYLNAYTVPYFIFANNKQFNSCNDITDSELISQIEIFAEQVCFLNEKLALQNHERSDGK